MTEFVILMAATMSLAALSIDAMLPALEIIGEDFSLSDVNDTQFVIIMLFIGIGLGQIFYGPLSDTLGRKPTFTIGLCLFIGGSLIAWSASEYYWLLIGRLIQGLGAAGARVISRAIIRDFYSGRTMAKIMSLVMSVFILMPAIAPSLGQGILWLADWRWIFLALMVFAVLTLIWLQWRLPESLHSEHRRPFTIDIIRQGIIEVVSNRVSLCYSICSGLTFGSLVGYLNSSRQIFQSYYDTGDWFAIYFGVIALSIGLAAIINSRIVEQFGMHAIVKKALLGLIGLSVLFLLYMLILPSLAAVPFGLFMAYIVVCFFCLGLSFGNFNALAMEPMGHIAGLASSVIGSISTFVSVIMGTLIGQLYSGNLVPITLGFLLLALLARFLMNWAEPDSKKPCDKLEELGSL